MISEQGFYMYDLLVLNNLNKAEHYLIQSLNGIDDEHKSLIKEIYSIIEKVSKTIKQIEGA